MKLNRHSRLVLLSLCIAAVTTSTCAAQQNTAPGVTDTEIRIGQTMAYSGPASAWGAVGRAELAYIKMINDRGGIRGRKITLISLDDGFSPPKTVEQTRKLVEGVLQPGFETLG
jgi:branched-chain amino acid transport system substrate-binding protein